MKLITVTALLVFLVGIARRILPLVTRRRLSAAQRKVMCTYATYYGQLDPEGQTRFERVVAAFVNDKEWAGSGIEVVDEMKVMIGSCAAQLLHGFPDVRLRHFDRILVSHGPYRSGRSTEMHMGEVRPSVGLIIISWSDFVQGYAHPRNAFNVGLHEMAHALWFENAIINGEDHFLDTGLLRKWTAMAHAEIAQMKGGRHSFLRSYAGTNEAEFFAVAVEYFFEQPKEFQAALPALYGTLSGLLRQDPAVTALKTEGAPQEQAA
jgi:Mlc titration factor MtfA (ptsG expression regulator)